MKYRTILLALFIIATMILPYHPPWHHMSGIESRPALRPLALEERVSEAERRASNSVFYKQNMELTIREAAVALAAERLASNKHDIVVSVDKGEIVLGRLLSYNNFSVTTVVKTGWLRRAKVEIPHADFLLLNKCMRGQKINFLGSEHKVLGTDQSGVILEMGHIYTNEMLTAVMLEESGVAKMAFSPFRAGLLVYILHNNDIVTYIQARNDDTGLWALTKLINGRQVESVKMEDRLFGNFSELTSLGPEKTIELLDTCFMNGPKTFIGYLFHGDLILFGKEGGEPMTFAKAGNGFALVDMRETVYNLREGRNTIGRNNENSIVINSGIISRNHAELIVEGDRVMLFDRKSRNGTQIADKYLIHQARKSVIDRHCEIAMNSAI